MDNANVNYRCYELLDALMLPEMQRKKKDQQAEKRKALIDKKRKR